MTTDQVLQFLLIMGAGGLAREILGGAWKLITGRQGRERQLTQQLVTELDHETSYRRRLEEMASEQRVMLIEQGVPRGELPTWPKRTTPTEGDI